MISYHSDRRPAAGLIAELYRAAPLNRPVDDLSRIRQMYEGSNIVVTAWDDTRLVGILRGWTDRAYDGYVCDLAVHPDHHASGVGRSLLNSLLEAHPSVQFVLRHSKIAAAYYEHLGWQKIENGWYWQRQS